MLRKNQSTRLLGYEPLDPRLMMSADGLAAEALIVTDAPTGAERSEPFQVRLDQFRIEVDVDRLYEGVVIELIDDARGDLDVEIEVPMPEFQAGDANRDYVFERLDIIQVLQAGKYLTGNPAGFSEGDFNRDGVFDQRDLVAALQTGNYMRGPYVETAVGDSTIDEILQALVSLDESSEISHDSRKTEEYRFDADSDGITDALLLDPDRDGDADVIHINRGDNTRPDGKPDYDGRLVDTDGDRFYDELWEDADGDREHDLNEFRRLVPPIPVVGMPKK